MRIDLTRGLRWPRWPVPVIVCGLVWLVLVGLVEVVGASGGGHRPTCLVKHLTGLPCPTCGTTRSGLKILEGEIVTAFWCNPMMFVAGVLFCAALLVRLVFARHLHMRLGRGQRRLAWVAAIMLLLANWAYVIHAGR